MQRECAKIVTISVVVSNWLTNVPILIVPTTHAAFAKIVI